MIDQIKDEEGRVNLSKLMEELEYIAETLSSASHEQNPVVTGRRIKEEEQNLYSITDKLQEIKNERV